MKMSKYGCYIELSSKKFPKEVLRFFNSPQMKFDIGSFRGTLVYSGREPAKAVLVDGKKRYMPMSKFKRLMERSR